MLGKDREVMARLSRLMVSRQGVLGGPDGGQVLVRLITTGILFWLESGICVRGVTLLCGVSGEVGGGLANRGEAIVGEGSSNGKKLSRSGWLSRDEED